MYVRLSAAHENVLTVACTCLYDKQAISLSKGLT